VSKKLGYIQDKGAQIQFFSSLGCTWKLKDKCYGADPALPKKGRTHYVAIFFQTEGSILLALLRLLLSTSPRMLRQLEICVHHTLQIVPTHLSIHTIEKTIPCLDGHLHLLIDTILIDLLLFIFSLVFSIVLIFNTPNMLLECAQPSSKETLICVHFQVL
jgi:hypothetical protein